jgi:integrase
LHHHVPQRRVPAPQLGAKGAVSDRDLRLGALAEAPGVKPMCQALGLPIVTAHGLRGTFADLAVEKGTASLAVARSLGHASFGVTARHYAGAQALSDAKARKAQAALQRTRQGIVPRENPSSSIDLGNETNQ